jgi:hypothetical protein
MKTTFRCIGGIQMNLELKVCKAKEAAIVRQFLLSRWHIGAVASGLVMVVVLALFSSSGCTQHCGACSVRVGCSGEAADAGTCPSHDGACALVGACRCAEGNCLGASSAGCSAADQASCQALAGCAWVTVCGLVVPCEQYTDANGCISHPACLWDSSKGCD